MKTFKCQKDPDTLPLPRQQGCLVQGVVSTLPHVGFQLFGSAPHTAVVCKAPHARLAAPALGGGICCRGPSRRCLMPRSFAVGLVAENGLTNGLSPCHLHRTPQRDGRGRGRQRVLFRDGARHRRWWFLYQLTRRLSSKQLLFVPGNASPRQLCHTPPLLAPLPDSRRRVF